MPATDSETPGRHGRITVDDYHRMIEAAPSLALLPSRGATITRHLGV